jgi:hypothetical protein
MARGWESKSVEGQVDEFKSQAGRKPRVQLTPQEAELFRQKELLALARAGVERDLQSCQDPRRREQLGRALAHIDAQLAALGLPDHEA